VITIAWRSLVSRRLAVLAALVSVVAGSALVTTALLVYTAQQAAGGAASTSSWRFDRADAVVKPPGQVRLGSGLALDLPSMPRLTREQQDRIAAAEGVASVSFETPFPAYAVTDDGRVIGDAFARSWGHPFSTAVADGAAVIEGGAPSSADEVAIDRGVAEAAGVSVGDRLRVEFATGVRSFVVSGIVERAGGQFEKALFFTAPVASREGGEPVLASVTFDGSGSAEDLRSALPGLRVLTGAGKATALQLDLRQAELAGGSGQFLLFVAFLALTIAVFVVSSTLSVSIQQRRRELAMLRVVGTRPKLVRRMVVWEGLFVGLLGGAVGCLAGIALAHLATRFFIAQDLMARATTVTVNPVALLVGLGSGVAATLVAAWVPARRATKISPLEALRSADVQPSTSRGWRTVLGWVLLAAAAAGVTGTFLIGGPVLTPGGNIAALLLFAALPMFLGASVLLGPQLLRLVLLPVGGLLRRWFPGFVAERSIRSDLRRAAGVSVPLALLVAVSCVFLFQDSANFQGQSRSYEQQLAADVVVTGKVGLGVPMNAATVVEGVPGVAAASARVSSEFIIDDPPTSPTSGTVTGVDPAGFTRVLDVDAIDGSWKDFGDGSIAISDVIASQKGWNVGDRIAFLYPDGIPGTATVTTIYGVSPVNSDMMIPIDRLTPHLIEPFAAAVYVDLEPGADREETIAAIDRALRTSAPGATAMTRDQHLADQAVQSSGDNWIVLSVVIVLGGYAGISAINVLIGSTMFRRTEFALLRLAGAKKKQVVSSVFVETLVVATTAVLVGTAIAAIIMIGYGYLIADDFWLPFVWPTYVVIVACAYLAALVGTLTPVQAALKASPLAATR
jgi:putative ABC transport system permease protein